MANDGQIVFEVTADSKHVKADIKDITKAIQSETKNWDKAAQESTSNIENSFSSMLKKLTAGFSAVKVGKALLDLGKDAVSAASDLKEVQNVVDTTFGSNSNQIEKWAKNAATQFGLTETMAKKFTSTMGAMLKSSGMAGDEIVQVSTDLAGLAADMSSFYNLDFEEAFAKIRSGISGQTMPLKELGIDMSVATLNAFALSQGIETTFDKMSQAEQTMLRYQYLMSATADAQGDFAKTTDGLANGLRLFESNLTTLKTNLGNVLYDIVNPLLQGINSLFPQEKRSDSLLDQIAEAQLQKDEKLAEIDAIREQADELINVLENIGANQNAGLQLGKLAEGANKLNASSSSNWSSILSAFEGVDGIDLSSTVGDVSELSSALAGNSVTTTKAQAWETLLNALANNADAMSALTGESAQDTAEWLKGLASAASELDPADADAWNTLLTSLVSGVSLDTEQGRQFVETLAQNFLAMGSDSEEAAQGLAALGYTTEDIEQKQATWLQTCKELVKTIPGLSSLIDTNTGEIKGGIPALKAYADEWERAAKYQAEIDALKSAKDIYNQNNNQAQLNANVTASQAVAYAKMQTYGIMQGVSDDYKRQALKDVGEFMKELVDQGYVSWDQIVEDFFSDKGENKLKESMQWVGSVEGEAKDALLAYAEAQFKASLIEKERPVILAEIESEEQRLQEEYNKTKEELEADTQASEENAQAMNTLEKAINGDEEALKDVKTAAENANDAIKAVADYAEGVRKSVQSSVNSVISGFEKVNKAGEDLRTKQRELAQDEHDVLSKYADVFDRLGNDNASLKAMEDNWDNLTKREQEAHEALVKIRNAQKDVNDSLKEYSPDTMISNLKSQFKFMQEYMQNLAILKTYGLSDEFIASLSDGSQQSAEYVSQLAQAGKEKAQEVDKEYQKVQEQGKEFTDTLTETQLKADETYQSLYKDAEEAVANLGLLPGAAGENAKAIVDSIAQGVSDNLPEVKTAVDDILAHLDRLAGLAGSFTFGVTSTAQTGYVPPTGSGGGGKRTIEGEFETGLDRVPFTGFLASLHEGEGILTAEENRIWQRFKNGESSIDYDTMGGVMRDNIKPGGNVYLDGHVVGSVISDQQGKSFRQLQRSGWQS